VFSRFAPRSGERTAKVFGYRVRLDLSDTIQRQIYLGVYEPRETRTVRSALTAGMTVIDIGANVGYFSLLAAQLVGLAGRVVAVEPSGYAADRLDATIRENGIAQIEVHRLGFSDRDGWSELYLPPASGGNHSPNMIAPNPSGKTVLVPVVRLDEALEEWHLKGTIDLLKIDVEGHEPNVFRGAEKSLGSGRVRAIVCEVNGFWLSAAGSSRANVVAQLAAYGFTPLGRIDDPRGGTVSTHFFRRTG
jgi:FkbM family methyltransferase